MTDSKRPPLRETVVAFTSGDGMQCNLVHLEGEVPASKGPVILIGGSGVRTNIFRPPLPVTLVDYLVAHGYDVWLENWRASIDLPPNPWTLDQAAVYDHPVAVATILRETGAERMKAFVHCQGSCGFVMSAIAGLLPQVETIVTNAVSLHPIVPPVAKLKLDTLMPLASLIMDEVNPHWGIEAPTLAAKLFKLAGELTHRSCNNTVCKLVSFAYGSGDPALWRHENIDDATHDWISGEFGYAPMSFYRQMARCVRRGRLVSVDGFRELPADFAAGPPQTDARFVFFAGEMNRCFLPVSQVSSYDYFNRQRKNFHALHVLPGYSHMDVLFGRLAARDVYPLIGQELDRPTARPARGVRSVAGAHQTNPPAPVVPSAL